MKYYLIAGESSGDMHGANLIRALKNQDPAGDFRAWGGDRMQDAGAEIVTHTRNLSFMGFLEVVSNLKTIARYLKQCRGDLLQFRPDVLILIDYPGFNLRMAAFAKKNNITVFYYVSPQVWAWKKNRIRKIKRMVDCMFVILPFEKEFYKEYGVNVFYGGHPVMDEIDAFIHAHPVKPRNHNRIRVALLPGSRSQEIKRILPVMGTLANAYPQFSFLVAGVSHHRNLYTQLLPECGNIEILYDSTYPLLHTVDCAVVTSGTATLETALFNVPQIVCYSGNPASVAIARWLIRIPFISLVNLILKKQAVTELIQSEFNPDRLMQELERILPGQPARETMLNDYKLLQDKIGGAGASARIAAEMYEFLTRKK
ncbi:MAG TPA: lipid-A-disaccharide synthase [Bacteroidales bacterium]|nr:lipid-A-disaccharide synthase [Bacteroidales bacterium]